MAPKRFNIRDIVAVGLMAALAFSATYINIPIPTPIGKTMIHMGNVVCLLSALLFGSLKGGLSAGIGSMVFDLFDPIYITQFWVTFINKFLMAFVTGIIYHGNKKDTEPRVSRAAVAAVSGALTYVILYIGKEIVGNYIILGLEWGTVWAGLLIKMPTSLINAVIAAAGSVLLNTAARPALKSAGLKLYDSARAE